MGKRRVGRYPLASRQMAVDRLRKCDDVVAFSEELGVYRRLLYKWRKQARTTGRGRHEFFRYQGVHAHQGDLPAKAPPDMEEMELRSAIQAIWLNTSFDIAIVESPQNCGTGDFRPITSVSFA